MQTFSFIIFIAYIVDSNHLANKDLPLVGGYRYMRKINQGRAGVRMT